MLTAQLSPIMDRMGRLLTDMSPHLMNDVTEFNSDLQNFRVEEVDDGLDSILEESSPCESEEESEAENGESSESGEDEVEESEDEMKEEK